MENKKYIALFVSDDYEKFKQLKGGNIWAMSIRDKNIDSNMEDILNNKERFISTVLSLAKSKLNEYLTELSTEKLAK